MTRSITTARWSGLKDPRAASAHLVPRRSTASASASLGARQSLRGESEPQELRPGEYWYVPGGLEHRTACVSDEPCLFYTHSEGPWDLTIVEWEE